ncbi:MULTISPECIES: DUF397 domain-containing protein [Streptomyces]|uniref:DUF397 domain-containing protein n=4 Tax=Streptomyces TaxID=1883 RepID=A0A0A0N8F1_STRRN|nr:MULTISPECIES: DUF397 domain-containing protein [Streptomyces]AGP52964.1 hypothetical protein M271_06700 [Streptomyces rapamycinicus NRRL 5491]MBB4780443.1 hypothetical protein [Streptomyces rapamycinicus]MBL1111939.1 DUF397 domain-containing protein [Streptomyces endocoffeicus]RLV74904.1 hypothetical protein D3C57_136800 [Streptomyces rapamycinicus NRRL 5491]UTO61169.1 DUF397 domain-containing protein [Streptomyces rapamycinicus]
MDQVHVYNGMPAKHLGTEGWAKPWSGPNGGACVEVMRLNDGRVALRQSTDPDGPALIYTHHEIEKFIQGAKAGAADFLLTRPENLTTSAGTAPERRAA